MRIFKVQARADYKYSRYNRENEIGGYELNYRDAKDNLGSCILSLESFINTQSGMRFFDLISPNADPEKFNYAFTISILSDGYSKISDKPMKEILEYIRCMIQYCNDPFEQLIEISEECRIFYDYDLNFTNKVLFKINGKKYDLDQINDYLKDFGLTIENKKYL